MGNESEKRKGGGALARKLINGAKEREGDPSPLSAREPIAMGISWILHGRRDRFTDLTDEEGGGGGRREVIGGRRDWVFLLTLPFHRIYRVAFAPILL